MKQHSMIRNIFLSYSSKDKEKVKPVADILEKKGYNVWMDKSGKVLGGDQFKDKIIQGIKECDVVLFFSSIHSNNSEWTAKEIGYAVKEHKKIVPIRLDNSEYDPSVAFDLVNTNFIVMQDDMTVERVVEDLVTIFTHPSSGSGKVRHRSSQSLRWIVAAVVLIALILCSVFITSNQASRPGTGRPAYGHILDEYGRVLAAKTFYPKRTSLLFDCTKMTDKEWDATAKDIAGKASEIFGDRSAFLYLSSMERGRIDGEHALVIQNWVDSSDIKQFERFFDIGIYTKKMSREFLFNYDDESLRVLSNLQENRYLEKGYDIRTTLNMDLQHSTDSIIRNLLRSNDLIEEGCLVILEASTGEIKAVSDLRANGGPGILLYNGIEPGHLLSPALLASAMEDGHISSLDEIVPASSSTGLEYYSLAVRDRETTVGEGIRNSSVLVNSYLAQNCYGSNPKALFDRLHTFKLLDTINYGLDGCFATPRITMEADSMLNMIANGYNIKLSIFNILAFYNAIANDGRMITTRIAGSLERGGKTIKLLQSREYSQIMSQETSQLVKDALRSAITEGTGQLNLSDSRYEVAGKTASLALAHPDQYGRRPSLASFAGFFPYDNPRYSVFAIVSSKPSGSALSGGAEPALLTKSIVSSIYKELSDAATPMLN